MAEFKAQAGKLINARNDFEKQLTKVHRAIEDSLTTKERGARVEHLLSKCQKLILKTIS